MFFLFFFFFFCLSFFSPLPHSFIGVTDANQMTTFAWLYIDVTFGGLSNITNRVEMDAASQTTCCCNALIKNNTIKKWNFPILKTVCICVMILGKRGNMQQCEVICLPCIGHKVNHLKQSKSATNDSTN